jgi:hypothetical protein
MKIYEEINKIVVPLLQRIMDIEKERTRLIILDLMKRRNTTSLGG